MKNIVFIHLSAYTPTSSSSSEKYLMYAAAELSKNYKIDLITDLSADRTQALEEYCTIHPFAPLGSTGLAVMELNELISTQSPQLVILNSPLPKSASDLLEKMKIKTLRIHHDFDLSIPDRSQKGIFRRLTRWLFSIRRNRRLRTKNNDQPSLESDQKYDLHITFSHFMKNELVHRGYPEPKIAISSLVAPSTLWQEKDSEEKELSTLLYPSEIIAENELLLIIEALHGIKKPFRLFVAGDGPHQKACEGLSRSYDLDDRITFLGSCDEKKLALFRSRAQISLLPSLELTPLSATGVECMRQALPVIAFDKGSTNEWLHNGRTGILVPNNDTKAFQRAIIDLLEDPIRSLRMGKEAFRRSSHFNPHQGIIELKSHIETLTAS